MGRIATRSDIGKAKIGIGSRKRGLGKFAGIEDDEDSSASKNKTINGLKAFAGIGGSNQGVKGDNSLFQKFNRQGNTQYDKGRAAAIKTMGGKPGMGLMGNKMTMKKLEKKDLGDIDEGMGIMKKRKKTRGKLRGLPI